MLPLLGFDSAMSAPAMEEGKNIHNLQGGAYLLNIMMKLFRHRTDSHVTYAIKWSEDSLAQLQPSMKA